MKCDGEHAAPACADPLCWRNDNAWEQVHRSWARSEWLLRGKIHKGDVQVTARVLDPATGEFKDLSLLPDGEPCTYGTYRVTVELLGHEDEDE